MCFVNVIVRAQGYGKSPSLKKDRNGHGKRWEFMIKCNRMVVTCETSTAITDVHFQNVLIEIIITNPL